MVKSLRDATGAPMMDCKKALSALEVNGDADLAVEWLRKKGVAAASAKAGRATNDGLVGVALSDDRRKGAVAEINCETDFVARNSVFQDLVDSVAQTVLQTGVKELEALKLEALEEGTVEEALISATANVGENITLSSAEFVEMANGAIGTYVHNKRTPSMGTKVALVALTCEGETADGHRSTLQGLADNLAMHIVGADPEFLSALPESLVERERDIESEKVRAKMLESGKEVSEDVLQGRVKKKVDKELTKLTQEKVLLKQPYIAPDAAKSDKVETVLNRYVVCLNVDVKRSDLSRVSRESKALGTRISISTALLYRVGEPPVIME